MGYTNEPLLFANTEDLQIRLYNALIENFRPERATFEKRKTSTGYHIFLTFVEDYDGSYQDVRGFVRRFLANEQACQDALSKLRYMHELKQASSQEPYSPTATCEQMNILILRPNDFVKGKEPSIGTMRGSVEEAMKAYMVVYVAEDGETAKILKHRW